MRPHTDVTRWGWLLVGLVLAGSGVRLMLVQEIHGRVRMPGEPPLLQGWPVFGMGLAEFAAGALLLWWLYRRWRRGG